VRLFLSWSDLQLISEHCQPEVLAHSNDILPIVFELLDDKTVAV
jgi:hypothetical protein